MSNLIRRARKSLVRVSSLIREGANPIGISTSIISYHLALDKRIGKYGLPFLLNLPCGAKVISSSSDAALASFDEVLLYKDYWLIPEYRPRRSQMVMDVGASLGLYTLICAKSVGEMGHVYAIEPEPTSYEILRQNISLNKLRNMTISNVALADFEGNALLHVPGWSELSSSIYQDHLAEVVRKIVVRVKMLDNVVRDFGISRIDLLKIDVEGAETAVLRGAFNSLQEGIIKKMVIEVHEFVPSVSLKGILALLRGDNYIIDGVFQSPLLEKKRMLYARLQA